jgi:hypothetical protein
MSTMIHTLRLCNTHLIVDQTPLLEESVHPHDCTHISRQVPPTSGNGKILCRIETVRVDHEISVILVNLGRFTSVLPAEKFWQRLPLERMNGAQVEPCGIGRDNQRVGLSSEVSGSQVMQSLRVVLQVIIVTSRLIGIVSIPLYTVFRNSCARESRSTTLVRIQSRLVFSDNARTHVCHP